MTTLSAELAVCLSILTASPPDPASLNMLALHAARAEAEARRQITKAWISNARGMKYSLQRQIDDDLFARVERADKMWADRIRAVSQTFTARKAGKLAASAGVALAADTSEIVRDRNDAREACRRLAAEVERLQGELTAARATSGDAKLHRAFYESAQFILAESTFNRIRDKAKALMLSVRR
jgi:hypothetical protein